AGQVADNVVDCGLLIGSLLELEARRELLVVSARRRIRVTLEHLARRIHVEQFSRHREHGLPGAALYFFPRAAAELVELGFGVVATDITLDQVYPLDRQVHRVVAGIFKVEEIAFDVGDLEMPQSAVFRDSMIDVNDIVVGLQLFEIEQRAFCGRTLSPMDSRLTKNFLFAVDVESVGLQDGSPGNLALHDRGAIVGPFEQIGEALTFGVYADFPRLKVAAETRDLMAALDEDR